MLEWDKDDRDKAIWQYLRTKQRCKSCGTHPEEWDEEKGGDRFAYSAVLGHCRGCQQVQSAQEQLKNKPNIRGTFVTLQPKTRGGTDAPR